MRTASPDNFSIMKSSMKYVTIIISVLMSAGIGYLSQIESEKKAQDDLFTPAAKRKSITFIMGVDKTDVPYYANAREHFALNEKEKTNLVVNACRTLECVISYLNSSEERGSLPWSVINIVAHGNPRTGLNLYLFDGGPKATPKRLVQAQLINSLSRLDNAVADSTSRINIWSCGIGKNPLINLSLKQLFKTRDNKRVDVYCSPHFVIFHKDTTNKVHRLKASYWPYYYKRGYRPSLSEIEFELKKKHKEEEINWAEGLRNEDLDTGILHQSYHIPVSYTRIYRLKTDRPDISSADSKKAWIYDQPSLVKQIEETGIPFEKYNWQVNKIIHTTDDGKKVPAIKAIGMSTVLNVLRIDASGE